MFDELPDEIVRKILAYNDPIHLIIGSHVCKRVHDLRQTHFVIPIMFEGYFELSDYNDTSCATARKIERDIVRSTEINRYHRVGRKYNVSSRRIFIQELIASIDILIDEKDHSKFNDIYKYWCSTPKIPSFYKLLLKNPRHNDCPVWVINKLTAMEPTSGANINYSSTKLRQLSIRALVY